MNYKHSSITIEEPSPGHFIIAGFPVRSVFIQDVGHLIPPGQVHISPDVPSDALLAVLEARGVASLALPDASAAPAAVAAAPEKPKRGRPAKTQAPAAPASLEAPTAASTSSAEDGAPAADAGESEADNANGVEFE